VLTTFIVLHIVVTVLLIAVVLLQEGKDPGMNGIMGTATEETDSFFSKNSGRTKQALYSKLTAFISILFLITTMVLVFLTAK
jgi:preprotein translocase subunit SecG